MIASPRLLLPLVAVLLAAVPAVAQAPTLAMLDALEDGQWQLRDSDNPETSRSICMSDGRQLLQLRHERSQCSRYIIADTPQMVTVHYTCPGAGHGRTTIRRETNRLVQVDTQGIANGAPFSVAYEARRVGVCN